MIALGLACLVALASIQVARLFFEQSSSRRAEEAKASVKPKVVERTVEAPSAQVLVAEQNMAMGSLIHGSMVRYQKWPAESVKPDYYAKDSEGQVINPACNPDTITGMRARIHITQGQPLVKDMLADQKDRSLLSFRLSPGMRAVTVPLATQSTAAQIFSPGDLVDVYAGEVRGKDSIQIEGIRILALDHNMSSEQEMKKNHISAPGSAAMMGVPVTVAPPRTVTLEVDPSWVAPLLAASQGRGATLVLRDVEQPGDGSAPPSERLPRRVMSEPEVPSGSPGQGPAPSEPPPLLRNAPGPETRGQTPPVPPSAMVRINRGGRIQDVPLTPDGSPLALPGGSSPAWGGGMSGTPSPGPWSSGPAPAPFGPSSGPGMLDASWPGGRP